MKWDKIGLFAGGVLFGTAGVKILSSKDAKKAYTHSTAAVLRAKEINEQRAEAEVVEDTAAEVVDDEAEETVEAAAE